MKELDLPYIGVKIESLPTILTLLKDATSDDDFISYYKDLGKSPKTASEYLASLRNLKLAARNSKGQTIINISGMNLIEGNVEDLYDNLLKHCLKNFKDLTIVKKTIQEYKVESLTDLINRLNQNDFVIKRKQTLSSYYKLFHEASKIKSNKAKSIFIYKNEFLEYNQFLKILTSINKKKLGDKLIIIDLYKEINNSYTLSYDTFIKYIDTAQLNQKIKLIEINPKILKDKNSYITIRNKSFYYINIF